MMLDTQVYSNTGGQNSDSSTMLGGYDMNQFGQASQGKLIEKKNVAEAFTSGHGSPFVAQVSMANSAKLYRAMLDGLEYRGTAFFQAYTTCQPEHGVADNMSADQAKMIRDARGMPEFVYDPSNGETYQENFSLKGNPTLAKDWWETRYKSSGEKYRFTVAHWALTEARFRKHLRAISAEQAQEFIHIDDMLDCITQDDVVNRKVFDSGHRSYIPDFKVYFQAEINGKMKCYTVSRQMVLFAVERRKSWRVLQSKVDVVNKICNFRCRKKVTAQAPKSPDLTYQIRPLGIRQTPNGAHPFPISWMDAQPKVPGRTTPQWHPSSPSGGLSDVKARNIRRRRITQSGVQDPEMAPSVDRESDFGKKFDFLVYRGYDKDVRGSLKGKSDGSVGNTQPCRSHLFESDKQRYVSRFNDLRDELTELRGQLVERDEQLTKLRGQLAERDGQLAERDKQLAELHHKLSRNEGGDQEVSQEPSSKKPNQSQGVFRAAERRRHRSDG